MHTGRRLTVTPKEPESKQLSLFSACGGGAFLYSGFEFF